MLQIGDFYVVGVSGKYYAKGDPLKASHASYCEVIEKAKRFRKKQEAVQVARVIRRALSPILYKGLHVHVRLVRVEKIRWHP